jgi:predicted nucleic acid-binding Zn ribbon protein
MAKKSKMSESQKRSMRTQQIIFGALGLLIILSMLISLLRF